MRSKLRWYGFFGLLRLFRDTIISRIFVPNCRIIRSPFYIRGWKEIKFGNKFTTGVGLRLDALENEKKDYKIIIGQNVQFNDYVHIAATNSVIIGDNVLIASKVFITDHNHGSYSGNIQDDPRINPMQRPLYDAPVIIEKNVWLGEFVSIMPGVTIGQGSIIGTAAVVNKNIPPFSIAVGTPAKVIKRYDLNLLVWIKV